MAFMRVLCFVLLVGLAAACQPQCPKCPPMWTFYIGNCYRYFGTAKTFAEAEKHCKEFTEVGQGHLASITSAEEDNLLYTMWMSVRGTTGSGLWIGFTDEAEEGNFIWTDRSAVSYTGWRSGEPNNVGKEHCTNMPNGWDGEWNDTKCGHAHAYMCKMTTAK
ncbi:alpha-N-acetylgalactosamine-specific lectin-like [Patiria miniata]|uniref:C-type lectin domain-containing protein n=1 Tax=Patiria miniata TaxID=46514 RepID=A0A914AM64_PATMI|nr:alpha-N-acetylgalactosamine-specific lectin-like [Patiria miniata]